MLSIRFHSGMSSQSDLRGALDAGVAVGVVAGKLSARAILMALPASLQRGVSVFIDSGAFHEVAEAVEPDWERVFQVYESVAGLAEGALGRLYVVAPDKVGDQAESLVRLARYRARVARLIEAGCRVIVPVQSGGLSAQQVIDRAADILGTRDFVVGIPSNKAALALDECLEIRHPAFHILGRVQVDEDQAARIGALLSDNPGAALTADANWMRSRLKQIGRSTEAERQRRLRARETQFFDHPRSAAITAALAVSGWGGAMTLSIERLRLAGYCVTSRKHCQVSRIDRSDWRERMARDHAPWDPEGVGMAWVNGMGARAADQYRRVYSRDSRTVPPEDLRQFPPSDGGPTQFLPGIRCRPDAA